MIKKYNSFINENLLKGKSKDDVKNSLSDLSIGDKIETLIENDQDITEIFSKDEILKYLSLMDIYTWYDTVVDLELDDEYLPIISDQSSLVIDKFKGDIKGGYDIYIKDIKLDFGIWADVWIRDGEVQFEWNQEMFNTNNSNDMMRKKIQQDGGVFSHVFDMIEEYLITNGIIE